MSPERSYDPCAFAESWLSTIYWLELKVSYRMQEAGVSCPVENDPAQHPVTSWIFRLVLYLLDLPKMFDLTSISRIRESVNKHWTLLITGQHIWLNRTSVFLLCLFKSFDSQFHVTDWSYNDLLSHISPFIIERLRFWNDMNHTMNKPRSANCTLNYNKLPQSEDLSEMFYFRYQIYSWRGQQRT